MLAKSFCKPRGEEVSKGSLGKKDHAREWEKKGNNERQGEPDWETGRGET